MPDRTDFYSSTHRINSFPKYKYFCFTLNTFTPDQNMFFIYPDTNFKASFLLQKRVSSRNMTLWRQVPNALALDLYVTRWNRIHKNTFDWELIPCYF